MLVLEPAAALPLKAERVFTAGLLPVWELGAGENSLPFQPNSGPPQNETHKTFCTQAWVTPASKSLPGRSGERAAEEREPCKSSGGQGSGLLLCLAECCAAWPQRPAD